MLIIEFITGFIGFILSLYAWYLHTDHTLNGVTSSLCQISEIFQCSQTLYGPFSSFLGIPWGLFGVLYFGFVISIVVISYKKPGLSFDIYHKITSTIGLITVLGLGYLSYILLKTICLVCLSTHITVLVYCILSWTRKTPENPIAPLMLIILMGIGVALPLFTVHTGLLFYERLYSTPKIIDTSKYFQGTLREPMLSYHLSKDDTWGDPKSSNIIQVFSDFQCPFCREAFLSLQQFGNSRNWKDVLLVYRHFPLSSQCNPDMTSNAHPLACFLAKSAHCAHDFKKTHEFYDFAYTNQITLSEESVLEFFKSLSLQDRFLSCMKNPYSFDADLSLGKQMGLTGTPLIFIRGKQYIGPLSEDILNKVLFP